MKKIAREIFETLNPENSVSDFLRSNALDLDQSHLIAMGKPSPFYAQALKSHFKFKTILSLTKEGNRAPRGHEIWYFDHPEVSERNLSETKKLAMYFFASYSKKKALLDSLL